MMRNKKEIAEHTLEIIEKGYFFKNGHKVEVERLINIAVEDTITIVPSDWEKIENNIPKNNYPTAIILKNCSTIQAIREEKNIGKIAVLNFASAKNPGGGFLGGASAQEESLARSSSLYATLIKDKTMYDYNKSQKSFLYSDYMIYSPSVQFWFNDAGDYLDQLYTADVITAPAPNKGAMLQHDRNEEIAQIELVLQQRIFKVLSLAASKNIETLILGAWGCGVFRNDPADVARLFNEVINEHFSNVFYRIIFAIYDSSKEKKVLNAFSNVFKN